MPSAKIDINTGLLDADVKIIIESARQIPEIEQLVLFGSRAKGAYKKGSDIDLAIKGQLANYDTAITLSTILNEEKSLPYFFDVVNYNTIAEPKLLEHIDRVGVILFERES